MKVLKDVVVLIVDFLYYIIMIVDKRKFLVMQNVIEIFLFLGIQVDYVLEFINFIYMCKKKIYEKCNCDFKQFIFLEVVVIMKYFFIFYVVIEKVKDNKLGIVLYLVVYFGLFIFVDIILKKM